MCPLTFKLFSKVACCKDNHVDTSNPEDGWSGAEESFVFQSGIFWVCPLGALTMPPWCENVSVDFRSCLKVCTLPSRPRRYLKLCRQFWQCRGKLHPSQSDSLDWVCPLRALNMPPWCEYVSVDCQTFLISCSFSRWSRGIFKLRSGVRWRREPAWKRQLAISPTTDLGLADSILILFEVFNPNFSTVQSCCEVW